MNKLFIKTNVLIFVLVINIAYGFAQIVAQPSSQKEPVDWEQLVDEVEMRYAPQIPNLQAPLGYFNAAQLKSKASTNLMLDSICEQKFIANQYCDYNWIYNYNESNELKTVVRTELSSLSKDFCHEITYQYKRGKLISEYETVYFGEDIDTTLTIFSKENEYDGNKLVRDSIYNLSHFYFFYGVLYSSVDRTQINEYSYNADNQLTLLRVYTYFTDTPVISDTKYHYTASGQKEYEFSNYGTIRYSYSRNGNFEKVSRYNTAYISEFSIEMVDTITIWNNIDVEDREFDDRNRLVALSHFYTYQYPDALEYDFKAEFEYTNDNQLLHASYYSYSDAYDSTSYYEATRIDNTYDEDGNLLEYHKTFYDGMTRTWKTYEKKTYYYSISKSAETFTNSESPEIHIYPNPVNEVLNLSVPAGFEGSYSIISYTGKTIIRQHAFSESIDVSELPGGIYLLQVKSELGVNTIKFQKN